MKDQDYKRLENILKEKKHAASNIIKPANIVKKKIVWLLWCLFFKNFKSFEESFIKSIVSQLDIVMNLHYDSLSYLDHTCRTSIRQHIRRYKSRFVENTHRIRCSGYCISDHSIYQTNQIYIDNLYEISKTIWEHEKSGNYQENHTQNDHTNIALNRKLICYVIRTFRASPYIIIVYCTQTGAVQWMASICLASRIIASCTGCAEIAGGAS